VPLGPLLAIATREWKETQEAFRTAGRNERRQPTRRMGRTKSKHPKPGELVDGARQQLTETGDLSRTHASLRCCGEARLPFAPTPNSIAGPSPACGRRARSKQANTRVLLPDRRRTRHG